MWPFLCCYFPALSYVAYMLGSSPAFVMLCCFRPPPPPPFVLLLMHACTHAAGDAMLEIYVSIPVRTGSCHFRALLMYSVHVDGGICVASVWLCRVLVPVLRRCTTTSMHNVAFHVLLPKGVVISRNRFAMSPMCLVFCCLRQCSYFMVVATSLVWTRPLFRRRIMNIQYQPHKNRILASAVLSEICPRAWFSESPSLFRCCRVCATVCISVMNVRYQVSRTMQKVVAMTLYLCPWYHCYTAFLPCFPPILMPYWWCLVSSLASVVRHCIEELICYVHMYLVPARHVLLFWTGFWHFERNVHI